MTKSTVGLQNPGAVGVAVKGPCRHLLVAWFLWRRVR